MAAVDTAYLAGFSGVAQPNIQTLIDAPTTELVTAFLETLVSKAQEFEETKAEQRRLEVELENAVHSGESRAHTLKASVDKALAEVESLRRKLNEEEHGHQRLQDELQSLQSSSSSSTTEVENLKAKVVKLESSNRDTLALLDTKSTAHDKLAQNLATQQTNVSTLRREAAGFQERLQNAESETNRAAFRESALQREVDLLKKNGEWLNNELQTKNADHSKFRKEKNARISQLQRTNEEIESNLAAARRTETSLRQRMDELSEKLENSFVRIQRTQDEASRTEESFRAELGTARRLAELQEQSAATSKGRVQALEEQAEQTRMEAGNEISQIQSELETERETREGAESKIEELELHIERLEATAAANVPVAASRPGTPSARPRGFATPLRHASPSHLVPGSAQSRGGLSYTQLFADFNKVKAELDEEKRRNTNYTTQIENMVDDLEKLAPELEEARQDKSRLELQVSNATAALESTRQERDSFRKNSRNAEGDVATLKRQEHLLRTQVRDREAQIRFMTLVLSLYEDGQQVSEIQREQLERLAMADFNDEAYSNMTDTDRFISQRLVTFRSIAELTETNSRLLNLTRQLGEQMEGDEAREKANERQELKSGIEKLQAANEQLRVQLSSVLTQSNSFVKERDMFRRMLENTKRMPSNANIEAMFGESTNGLDTPRTPRIGIAATHGDQTPASRDFAEQMKLIKEMQAHFDAYKREAATDHSTLRVQIDTLAKEKSDLQSEAARVKSQLYVAQERYDMLQANFNLSRSENQELQSRARSLEETSNKQEIRGQQFAEELVQTQELSEGLRSENSNLKAEKELWKRIEARLNEDNQSLTEERARLNKLVADTQSLSNQRETSDSETRRALQAQIESLDSELLTTKQKLEEEANDSKQANRRRELEIEQSRTRQDDLMKTLGTTKEDLVEAKTTRDQLQARVEELKIELRNAQERAEALQPRPTPRPTDSAVAQQASINNEQELLVQVSDLKRDLDLTRTDLESANAQIEQYKAIAQSAEDSLNSLQDSHAQYNDDTEKVVGEKDLSISQLEQRVQDISDELSESTRQLNEVRSSENDFNSRLELQKATYDEDLHRVQDECDRLRETAKYHQQDLKSQAEIAQQAQQSYETELVRHAEAAKLLTTIRDDFNASKVEISTAKANADAARLTLVQNEESWSASRENYEREIVEMKRGRDELRNQNNLLHQQLEGVSAQIAELQQTRAVRESHDEEVVEGGLQNLQEIIKYLRREKEIVDVQYNLSTQEASRLKQQLSYAQSQLDDVRIRLDQERQRQSDTERSSQSHSKMVETLNEINVYRESNASLRSESTRLRAQLELHTKKTQDLQAQLEPLHASLHELENKLETADGETKLLQEDRDRWQKRTQDILQKYDRVDPAELEELRNKLSAAEQASAEAARSKAELEASIAAQKSELEASIATQKAELDETIATQISIAKIETRDKLQDQFKERARTLSARVRTAEDETKVVREKLQALEAELITARQERDSAVSAAEPGRDGDLTMKDVHQSGEEGEIDVPEDHAARTREASLRADALQKNVTDLQGQVEALQSKSVQLQEMLDANEAELISLRQKSIPAGGQTAAAISPQGEEHIQKLQSDLEVAQNELAAIREAPAPQPLGNDPTEEVLAKHQAEIDHLHEQLKASESKSEAEKASLQARIEELQAKHDKDMKALKLEHDKTANELEVARATAKRDDGVDTSATTEEPAVTDKPLSENEQNYWQEVSNWTNEELKKFLSANEHVKRLVSRNVFERVRVREDELTQAHALEMEELKSKLEKSRESGIELESKKWKVKINIAENKARIAVAKIEIISKAAQDTPDKPVAEIWAIVKDYKPPAAGQLSAASNTASQEQPPASAPTPETPTIKTQGEQDSQNTSVQGAESATSKQHEKADTDEKMGATASNIPQRRNSQVARRPSQIGERPLTQPPSRPSSRQGSQNGTGPAALKAQSTGIPQPGRGSAVQIRGAAGRGSQGGQTSRLPDAPLGQGQNTGIPRPGAQGGGGREGQRGGGRGMQQGRGYNPSAGNFTPQGAKRAREDDGSAGAGRAKFARGGNNT